MNGDGTLSKRRVGELSLYVRIVLYVRVFPQEIIATIVGIPLPTDTDDQFIVKPKLLDSQDALDKWNPSMETNKEGAWCRRVC